MKILGFLLIGVGIAGLLSVVWPVIAIGAGVVVLYGTMSERPTGKKGFGIWFAWPKFFRKSDEDAEANENQSEARRASM